MEQVSYLRPTGASEKRGRRAFRRTTYPRSGSRRGRYIAGGVLLLAIALIAGGALVLLAAKPSLKADPNALARVSLPLGGGKIESVSVTTGPHSISIPVELRGDQIWPKQLIPAHQRVSIDVVVKRPGWISWLSGSAEHVRLALVTPSATLRSHYLTLRGRASLRVSYRQPIKVIAYGTPGHLQRRVLATPSARVTLPHTATAGTLFVAATPRSWESAKPSLISWFPAGAAASAVASPAPGTQIHSTTPISLTFNKPVSQALGSTRPPVSPTTAGTWHTINSHTIVFRPVAFGYGLGSTVNIALPKGVRLVGGQQSTTSSTASWRVPGGSPLRLQQLLALLGYLPLNFHYNGRGVGLSPQAELNAAIHPPAGHFTWRYRNVPSALRGMWAPGAYGTMTEGALMAFENDHGLATVGLSNPLAWKYLIQAALAGNRSTFGYTFVTVDKESSPEQLTLWHNGHTVVTAAVNTGIAQAPTVDGTFPVYEHLRVGTMSGTNPDGSHYNDPGIQFISYFNGGDALHAFTRAQYGFPQSLGCVEMQLGSAGQVWPYTPIGALVHVA